MKKYLILLLSISLFTCGSQLFAQGCDEPSESGDEDEKIKLFGFMQAQYDHILAEEPTSTFKFKRARIGVRGDIPYDFAYYAVLEASPFLSGQSVTLLDAFISYKRFEWAKISVGAFKQPFGLEVNTACHSLHTIERSLVSDQLVIPQRDMGIMILGGTKETFVRYSAAIMNGTGLLVEDNNTKKDVIGRLVLQPFDFLRFGGSYRYGFPNNDSTHRISYAAELELEYANFLLQAEYIADEGDYNRGAGGGCGGDPMVLGDKRSGYFVQAMYTTRWMLQPVIKYESFDPGEVNNETITNHWVTAGLNYWFNDWVRLQVNYQYKAEKGNEVDNDAILIQLQAKF